MTEIRELLPQISKRIAEEHSAVQVRVRALAFDKDGYIRFSLYSKNKGREINSDGDWLGYENGVWPPGHLPIIGEWDLDMQPFRALGGSSINEEQDEELFNELNLMIEMEKI